MLFIAAGAGVGGGPVLVPLYLIAGALTNVAAVALSNVTILAGSVASTGCNLFKRHPWRAGPLINYDLILLMQPPTTLGAVGGSYINQVRLLPAPQGSPCIDLLLCHMQPPAMLAVVSLHGVQCHVAGIAEQPALNSCRAL